jgi:hypothetical protein
VIEHNDVVGQEILSSTESKTKKTKQIKINDTAKGVIARRHEDNLNYIPPQALAPVYKNLNPKHFIAQQSLENLLKLVI